ncbi:MAG: radical SAM protein [Candidatus Omnitrophica bacterium]|nr:radical SAM protein [Candidatus Omnitrophota bacterium]
MKICLINPPQILNHKFGIPNVFQPLGLLYVAANLERDFQVEIIDASLEGWNELRKVGNNYYLGLDFGELEERIRDIKPDIVGITIPFSINEKGALKVGAIAKDIDKDIITIFGGAHTSVRPLETLSYKQVDYVVIGEGEDTALELIKTLESKDTRSINDIKGIGYKLNGQPILTPPREWVRDIDTIRMPARNLIPMEKYFIAAKLNKAARSLYNFSERWTSIITSRGCPYRCNFCSIHHTMGERFRPRSPKNVIVEIKQVVEEYGIRHINFEDDNLTLDKERAKEIFNLIEEEELDITWSAPNGIRADSIDEELVRAMKRSGCRRVFVAPESGVQRIVSDIIGKQLDLRKVEKAVILFNKYGIIVDGSFVIGSIGETLDDIHKTIRYALRLKRLGMRLAGFHIATPYYGTRLYKEAKEKGFLRSDFDSSLLTTAEPSIITPEWGMDEIKKMLKKAQWTVNYNFKEKVISLLSSRHPRVYKTLSFLKRLFFYPFYLRELCLWFYYIIALSKNSCKNLISRLVRMPPKVKYMVYEVTDACNSQCQHCYIWRHKPAAHMLTPDELEEILRDDFFSNLKVVLLTGGEPVLRGDIHEIISVIHKVRPYAEITLSTNALLPERVLEVLRYTVAHNIKINIGVSVDAIGERHDLIRGVKGNFEKADYLLSELIKLKQIYKDKMGSIVIGQTVSNLTADTLKDVLSYAQRLNVGYLPQLYEEFIYYHNINNSRAENYRLANNENLEKAIKELPPTFHNELLIESLRHRLRFRCACLMNFFVLRCDGSVSPCLKYSETKIGNIRLKPPSEVWNSQAAKMAKGLVVKCDGCSNAWATAWSLEDCFFPFLRTRIKADLKALIKKIMGNN